MRNYTYPTLCGIHAMFTFLSENNVEFFFESEYIYRNIYTDNNYTTFLNFFFILPALMNSSIFIQLKSWS